VTDGAQDDASSLVARDRTHLWHPYASMPGTFSPLAVASASGTRLTLADGRVLVDAMSSWWAAIHGYRHPVLDQAVRDQLDRVAHVMFGGLTHGPAVELAELLVELAPGELRHVFLTDSGSVSVEVAMKMALQYARGVGRPARTRMLTVRGGYHGDTFGAMSVCDPVTGMHSMFTTVLADQLFAPLPEPTFGERLEPRHIASFDQLIDDHADEIAAVILEPVVQGAGGMRFYAPEYLRAVRAACDRHDVLLIADEIATGFGRTGELFGCDHAAVAPDIMCVGKALTGGYLSMAATLCTPRVAAGVSAAESGALMHGPTFMGNPLAAAVASASVGLLVSSDWRGDVDGIEQALASGLAPAAASAAVADVRVLGSIGVIEMVDDVPIAAAQQIAVDRGVWIRPFGKLLYTMPPYVSTDADLTMITDAMVAITEAVA
jgi:adenosylmethionine---8-amino-7-oxononanoate aminotransferase